MKNLPDQYPTEKVKTKIKDQLLYSFDRKTGILETGSKRLYGQFVEKFGEIPEEGINMTIRDSFASRTIDLQGVKRIQLAKNSY